MYEKYKPEEGKKIRSVKDLQKMLDIWNAQLTEENKKNPAQYNKAEQERDKVAAELETVNAALAELKKRIDSLGLIIHMESKEENPARMKELNQQMEQLLIIQGQLTGEKGPGV